MSTSTSKRLGIVVAIACLTTCFAVATVYSSQAVFSDISIKYGMSVSDARFAFSICSIAYALAFFVMGPLSDLFSARVLAATGLLVAAGATALSAVSANQLTFVFASAVQGASAAAVPVAMFALLPRLARKDQVGTYFGLIIAASVVGITLGRAGMGLLTASVGLSAAQMGSAIILLIMSVLLAALPKVASHLYAPRGPGRLRQGAAHAGFTRSGAAVRYWLLPLLWLPRGGDVPHAETERAAIRT